MLPGQPSADWLAYSLTWGLLGEPGISWSGSSCAVGPPEKVQSAVSSCWFCLFLHKVSATFIHAPDSFDFSPLTQSLQPSSHTVNPSFINPALTPPPQLDFLWGSCDAKRDPASGRSMGNPQTVTTVTCCCAPRVPCSVPGTQSCLWNQQAPGGPPPA